LVASHDVERLVVADGKGGRIALTPIDCRRGTAGNSQHAGTGVDADDVAALTHAVSPDPRDDPGATANVEEAPTGGQGGSIEQQLRKGAEQRLDEELFVQLREACRKQAG
jgi:hypothetical protein